jgi:tripartite-type tricarboxylate transporter receptor subunit TctC
MLAPSQTPRAIVGRLHEEVAKALTDPEVRARLTKLGAEPMPMCRRRAACCAPPASRETEA